MAETKEVTLSLTFNEDEAIYLIHMFCCNFYKMKKDSFEIISGNPDAFVSDDTMYFHNDFLGAKIFKSYMEAQGYKCSLLLHNGTNEEGEAESRFVTISNKPYGEYMGIE